MSTVTKSDKPASLADVAEAWHKHAQEEAEYEKTVPTISTDSVREYMKEFVLSKQTWDNINYALDLFGDRISAKEFKEIYTPYISSDGNETQCTDQYTAADRLRDDYPESYHFEFDCGLSSEDHNETHVPEYDQWINEFTAWAIMGEYIQDSLKIAPENRMFVSLSCYMPGQKSDIQAGLVRREEMRAALESLDFGKINEDYSDELNQLMKDSLFEVLITLYELNPGAIDPTVFLELGDILKTHPERGQSIFQGAIDMLENDPALKEEFDKLFDHSLQNPEHMKISEELFEKIGKDYEKHVGKDAGMWVFWTMMVSGVFSQISFTWDRGLSDVAYGY